MAVSKGRVVDIVEQLSLPIVQEAGLELVDVEYKKEGGNWYLRVFIDKPGGVDVDDCSHVSELLSERLDEVDPIPAAYFLEVSSPGAERPLRNPTDYERAVGQHVHVSLYEPVQGVKSVEGVLIRYTGELAEVEWNDRAVLRRLEIPVERIASARLSVQL